MCAWIMPTVSFLPLSPVKNCHPVNVTLSGSVQRIKNASSTGCSIRMNWWKNRSSDLFFKNDESGCGRNGRGYAIVRDFPQFRLPVQLFLRALYRAFWSRRCG
jgi:hypothetical protein